MGKEFIELVKEYLKSVDKQSDSESNDKEDSNSAMRYIRTKDGIFEVKATPQSNAMYRGSQTYRIYDHILMVDRDVFEKDIVKQANTIEELIDCYVRVCQPNTDNEWHNILSNKNDQLLIKNKHIDYGEIWVDGELHKVAEVNDKGELKLL